MLCAFVCAFELLQLAFWMQRIESFAQQNYGRMPVKSIGNRISAVRYFGNNFLVRNTYRHVIRSSPLLTRAYNVPKLLFNFMCVLFLFQASNVLHV